MKMQTVMIVDDNEGDQLLTKLIVEAFDDSIAISQAYDGREALNSLVESSIQPDLIFLDINMPVMDGYEFLEEFERFGREATVVLMLSSSIREVDRQKILRYRVVKKDIEKPVTLDMLRKI